MNTASRILKLALLADTSQFGKNMDKAQRQTKTFSSRVTAMGKVAGKAFLGIGAAVAGMSAKLAIDGVKAAIEDQKSQVTLAKTLQNTTKATKGQTAAVETYIDKLARARGVSDSKLRPSLSKLLVATGSITKAQKLQALAMDISAGTGKDLETVSTALAKGYNGNLGALTKLGIKIDDTTLKNKDFNAAAKELNKTFSGQSAAAAETMQGKMDRLTVAFDEAKESIGYALLPVVEEFVDYLSSKEGKEAVENFAVAFADSVKLIAEYLPGIISGVKKLVGNIKADGLLGIFADPRVALAATAFVAGSVAGGPMVGAIAAMAAWAAADGLMGIGAGLAGGGQKQPYGTGGEQGPFAPGSKFAPDRFKSQLTETERRAALLEPINTRYTKQSPSIYNISVNSLDPVGAARAVTAAINKANRLGVGLKNGAPA